MNVVVSVDSEAGASIAPNAPCAPRAITSTVKPVAAPPSAEAAANPTRPIISIRRRPTRSDSRPPSSSSPPKASEYAVTTHCRSAMENPSARWAEGSAMFTIVASSTTISCASPTTPRTHQRRDDAAEASDGPACSGTATACSPTLRPPESPTACSPTLRPRQSPNGSFQQPRRPGSVQ